MIQEKITRLFLFLWRPYTCCRRISFSNESRLQKSSAFTLVEVLVVVVVLVILLALISPALNMVKSASDNAVCVSNLKRIGVALMSYAADHDGALIPGATLDNTGTNTWFTLLNEQYMGGNANISHSSNPPSWLECPAKKFPPGAGGQWNGWQCIGYGWNWCGGGGYTIINGAAVYSGGFGNVPSYPGGHGWNSRLAEVTQPSKTIIIGDSMDLTNNPIYQVYMNGAIYPPIGSNLPDYWRARRHGGNGNYLMVDGHVESLPPTMATNYFEKIQ